VPPLIFRKGLDLKEAVADQLAADYHSTLVDEVKAADYTYRSGRLAVHLAREFGFCYGVDRAVDYAYQARSRFAERRVFLTGEIIHNPHVNDKLRAAGVRFLSDAELKAITKALAEANHARFRITSQPDDGTLVEVAFPATRVLVQ